MNVPEMVIVHHSATDGGTFESIKRYHVEHNGWRDIGYHYLITTDGVLHKGRDEKTEGAHCKEQGCNRKSIGICLVGHFDNYAPNEAQMDTLYNLLDDIFVRYGKLEIYTHNHFATYKTCPGTQFPFVEVLDRMYNNKKTHWAEGSYQSLISKGIKINEKRFDDKITRGEIFSLLDQIVE